MRKRALIPVLVISLLPTGIAHAATTRTLGHTAAPEPQDVIAIAAASMPRRGFVSANLPGRHARLRGAVHVDDTLQRLGFSFAFHPPESGTIWARLWFGEREEDGGCSREVVLQGTGRRTGSWSVHEAGGSPIAVTADYSVNSRGDHQLRWQLDRPDLPGRCVRVEFWRGNANGPTTLLLETRPRRLVPVGNNAPGVSYPRELSLPWGETTATTGLLHAHAYMPTIVHDLSASLAPRPNRPAVVSAESEPIASWDFWRDGSARIDLPATPTEPWGTSAELVVATANSVDTRGNVRLWISHPPPTDWVGSLSGVRLWIPRARWGRVEQPTMSFVDGMWVHLAPNSTKYLQPTCQSVSDQWNEGCHRYWYDADTGRLQIDDLQARVTGRGWRWQRVHWNASYRVRTLAPGATRRYHGTGKVLPCAHFDRTGCSYFAPAEVWLRKDGRYRWIRDNTDERGHYESLANSRLKLDPGEPGGKTRIVPLGIFGKIVNGEWRVIRFHLDNTMTKPVVIRPDNR